MALSGTTFGDPDGFAGAVGTTAGHPIPDEPKRDVEPSEDQRRVDGKRPKEYADDLRKLECGRRREQLPWKFRDEMDVPGCPD